MWTARLGAAIRAAAPVACLSLLALPTNAVHMSGGSIPAPVADAMNATSEPIAAAEIHSPLLSAALGAGVPNKPRKIHVPNPRKWMLNALEGDGALFQQAVGVSAASGLHLMANMIIFSGSSNPPLAEEIAYELHKPLGKITLGRYADGEVTVQVLDNIRGKDVFIVQSTSQPVNENFMELLLMISTMRRASARTITAVIPYYGYKRDVGVAPSITAQLRSEGAETNPDAQTTASGILSAIVAGSSADGTTFSASSRSESMQNRAFPVSAADMAKMLEVMGVDRVVSVDLQPPGQGQIEGFFPSTVPVENLRSTAVAVEHFRRVKMRDPVVVSPNESCIQLAKDFASGLRKTTGQEVGLAAIIEGGDSRGSDRYMHVPKRKSTDQSRLELVGDVKGHDVIIVDDMIDTGYTLVRRLQLLQERGAGKLYAYATHGLFNGGALHRINKSALSEVVVTNSVPLRDDVDMRHTHKIAQLSIAPLVAAAMLRVQTGQSLQSLRVFDRDNIESRYLGQE